MVKALSFKGDKKSKKRKRDAISESQQHASDIQQDDSSSRALARSSTAGADPDTASSHKAQTNYTEDASTTEDDSWVSADTASDVAGPVIFVMGTQPATCIASDAHGKVFASELFNVVEGDAARTAEPHDVRQVWVANRVAGTESFSFKGGHHGRYLGCDRFGILSATREAISPEESFTIVPVPDVPGAFAMQTPRDKYVGVQPGTEDGEVARMAVRGDADVIAFSTTLRIRMQARFKPRLRASKAEKAREKISRKELEEAVGRSLEDVEVKTLKRARRKGNYHEALLDVKVKGKHDKFA